MELDEVTKIELSKKHIIEQLLQLSKKSDITIDDFTWDPRDSDWKSNVHYLAVYIAGKRSTLPFFNEELIYDYGTKE